MKVNVTMLARGREKLTLQSVRSLRDTACNFETMDVTILDDAGEPPVHEGIWAHCMETEVIRNKVATGGAGPARNQVIRAVRERGDLLYLSDNDVYFTPGWLDILTDVWPHAYMLGFRVLGGWSHPYNAQAVNVYPAYSESTRRTVELRECLAVATQSWLMDWETWDEWGPFDEAPGVRQSEDVAFCNRMRAAGYKVGYVSPFVVWSTSKTDTFGQQVPGAELITVPEGIICE